MVMQLQSYVKNQNINSPEENLKKHDFLQNIQTKSNTLLSNIVHHSLPPLFGFVRHVS